MAHFTTELSDGQGAAGTFYYYLTFTNTSEKPILFNGVPTVQFVDDNGLFAAISTYDGSKGGAIQIKPGEKAYALLAIPDPGDFGPPPYKSIQFLLVTVPGRWPQLIHLAKPVTLLPAHAGRIGAITKAMVS